MKIGLIGAGVIGCLRAESVRRNPETELVAVLDTSEPNARAATKGTAAPALDDPARFHDVDMDAVIVSSPGFVHEEACLAAFERGRHVLCEKPLSNTVESSLRILKAAQDANRVLGVGFNLRYYPAMRDVKEAVESGVIGELDHLRIFGGHEGLPKFRVDWQYRAPESGGGAMMDVGVHMTDLARWLLGEITEVYGIATESVWNVAGSEDNAMAIFRSPTGVSASYHATWTEWKGYHCFVEAYGSLGMVRGEYAPMRSLLITQEEPGGPTRVRRNEYWRVRVREKLKSWHSTALLSFESELHDFLAMTQGRADVTLADGLAGLRAVEVADAVKRSMKSHEVATLPVLGRIA